MHVVRKSASQDQMEKAAHPVEGARTLPSATQATVYMAPSLLLHYILDHDYRPPTEFLKALSKGRFLTEDDLIVQWRQSGEGFASLEKRKKREK